MTIPADSSTGLRRKFYTPQPTKGVLSGAAALGLFNGLINPGLRMVIPLWIVIVVMVWFVPVSVVTDSGIRVALFRRHVAWHDVAQATVRRSRLVNVIGLKLTSGRTVSTAVPGTEIDLIQYFVYRAHNPPDAIVS